MKSYFGYIRVSTARQGTHGVSLTEQTSAIERYASHNGLSVIEWFEERETAAKRGRPVFSRMLTLLRKGKANGVLIHKIDRSARNLKDWADLGEMIDAGVEIHFAADALDLNSRGGRLSADIQAVVAADYIRNLREETRKGFYGRLKQGLYPLAAPIGYLDQGGGRAKTPDPRTAPLVRTAFELYGTGKHSLRSLQSEFASRGLKNVRGGALSLNGLSKLLSNPFYCGLIRLRSTGETFKGLHEPLISVSLFERVQQILKGKCGPKVVRHEYLFRRLIRCAICDRLLVGERQKGRVYYRCHTIGCPTTTVREDEAEALLLSLYARVQLTSEEATEARRYLQARKTCARTDHAEAQAGIALQLADARSRMDRLTDALVDGLLDRPAFEERRGRLMLEVARLEERAATKSDDRVDLVTQALELASILISSHESANDDEKRRIVEITTSNFALREKELEITASEPFLTFANRHVVTCGDPQRDTVRTSCQSGQVMRSFIEHALQKESDEEEAHQPSQHVRHETGNFPLLWQNSTATIRSRERPPISHTGDNESRGPRVEQISMRELIDRALSDPLRSKKRRLKPLLTIPRRFDSRQSPKDNETRES